jgi:hypothetical protein
MSSNVRPSTSPHLLTLLRFVKQLTELALEVEGVFEPRRKRGRGE